MNTKSIFQSKTFWLNVIAMIVALFPACKAWIAANPESTIGVLTALNVIVRFATSGRISLFGAGELAGPELVLIWGMAAGLCMGLPSCSPDQREALQAIPIRVTAATDYGTVGYSSKGGISVYVDRRSGK